MPLEDPDRTSREDRSKAEKKSEYKIEKIKVKKEDDLVDKRDIHEGVRRHNISSSIETEKPDVKQEAENNTMTCKNCEISFVNSTTYAAHVKYYCKKKKDDEAWF